MSVRLAGDRVLSWVRRACCQRLPWQHRSARMPRRRSPLLAGGKFDTGLCQGPDAGRCINMVRFYSQAKTQEQDRSGKEGQNPVQPPQAALLPTALLLQSPPPPEQPASWRTIYAPLSECGSPVDVLDLLSRYPPALWNVCHCLTRMWSITKTMSKEQKTYELRLMSEHAVFKELLLRTAEEAGRMSGKELTVSLLAVTRLGVAPRSRVVQTLLAVCQERLNELEDTSLSVLANGLAGLEGGASAHALSEGLRSIIVSRLPSIEDVMVLQTLMRHVGKGAPWDVKKKLERKALSLADGFSLANAQHMVFTLAALDCFSRPLLHVCSQKIAENIQGTPYNVLSRLLKSYRTLQYRDVSLFLAVSEYVASTIDLYSNRQVIVLLSAFEDLGFCPAALMDLFLERVVQNPDALKLMDVLSILKTYSSLNHDLKDRRQQFLDSITQVLQSYLAKMSASELLRAVSCLCVLAHFPPAPLGQLLQNPTLDQLRTTDAMSPRSLQAKLRTVDLCLRLDRPAHARLAAVPSLAPGPPDQRLNLRLSKTLRGIVGDAAVLQEGVLVENHYFIDAVITRPLQGTAQSEHSQRIAVICAPPSLFCYGTSRPSGKLAVKLRHLQILGFSPVLVEEEESAEVIKARIFPSHQRRNTEPGAE